MIIIVCGGVGSGKSVHATRQIEQRKNKTFGNFSMHNIKNYRRLKIDDVLKKQNKKTVVNWDFWKRQIDKHGGFDIVLDELHNLMHARRSMSNANVSLSKWVSQIRKVMGESEQYNLTCISQIPERIDLSIRDLARKVIYCKKIELQENIRTLVYKNNRKKWVMLPKTYIFQRHFVSESNTLEKFNAWKMTGDKKLVSFSSYFLANPYFKYYDSYGLIDFGEEGYL